MIIFESFGGLLRVVVMAITAYVALIGALRIAGKRSLSKLNAFDLVVTVALGSTLATVLLSSDIALAEGVLAFAMLLALQWAVAKLSLAWRPFKRAVRSEPRLLCRDGEILGAALEAERLTRDEVVAAIRNQGIGRLDEVAGVVLETDGSLSVIRKGERPPDLLP